MNSPDPSKNPNPFEAPKTSAETTGVQSPPKVKLSIVLILLLLVPAVISNAFVWVGFLVEQISPNFFVPWILVVSFIFVPITGLFYGAGVGNFLYYRSEMRYVILHPAMQATLQPILFFGTMLVGCICTLTSFG
jgi:hypothetical protein